MHGVTAVSFWQDPFTWLDETKGERNIPRGLVNHVEAAANSLTVIDWVLLAVAGALIAWVWSSLQAITRLGPIEVAALEHDGKDGDGVPVKALTAQLREALSRTGLSPPPAVPAGTPQINLIDAIKESPIPQANWIAAIIQLVPRPRPSEYHISGVLLGSEPVAEAPPTQEPADGDPEPTPCGLRFAVVPAGDGSSELSTVVGFATHSEAVIDATSEMFLHISQDATAAFPIWARWHHKTSLEAFVDSWQQRQSSHVQAAINQLEAAKSKEPFNALADLQVANLYEKCEPEVLVPEADAPGDDAPSADVLRAQLRAHAVRRYLEVADAFPEVVEARYRLAIAAGTLASIVDQLNAEATAEAVVGILSLEDADTAAALPGAMRELANRECDAVLELLRPWWALTRFRLRTQFEPRGYQRRVMRRTVRISRHCHGLRRLAELDPSSRRVRARIRVETRMRSALVHRVHLSIGFGTAGWQAHYNAACFDALLLEHFP